MSKIARWSKAWVALAAVVFSSFGCGGRTSEDPGDPGDPNNGADPSTTPVPACADICRSAVDRCLPGGTITACANDCEKMRTQYQGCEGLAPFLRCMPTVPVICTPPDKVEFNGCNDERNSLVRCRS